MDSFNEEVVHIGEMTFKMPFENVIPPLDPDQLAEVEASIKEEGIRVPVLLDQYDRVIDGHNRIRLAVKYDITKIPVERIEVKDDAHAKRLVIELNLKRRHLNSKQRGLLAELLLKMNPECSNRELGRVAGVDHQTVQARREKLESSGEIPHCETVQTKDGRKHPLKRKPRKSAARKAAEEAQAVLDGREREPGEDDGLFDERDEERDRRRREANKPKPARKDAIGNTIPDELRDLFGDAVLADCIADFEEAQRLTVRGHERLKRKVQHFPFVDAKSVYDHIPDAEHALMVIIDSIKPGIPYALCPVCRGKDSGKCKVCRFGGYLPEWRFNELQEQEAV